MANMYRQVLFCRRRHLSLAGHQKTFPPSRSFVLGHMREVCGLPSPAASPICKSQPNVLTQTPRSQQRAGTGPSAPAFGSSPITPRRPLGDSTAVLSPGLSPIAGSRALAQDPVPGWVPEADGPGMEGPDLSFTGLESPPSRAARSPLSLSRPTSSKRVLFQEAAGELHRQHGARAGQEAAAAAAVAAAALGSSAAPSPAHDRDPLPSAASMDSPGTTPNHSFGLLDESMISPLARLTGRGLRPAEEGQDIVALSSSSSSAAVGPLDLAKGLRGLQDESLEGQVTPKLGGSCFGDSAPASPLRDRTNSQAASPAAAAKGPGPQKAASAQPATRRTVTFSPQVLQPPVGPWTVARSASRHPCSPHPLCMQWTEGARPRGQRQALDESVEPDPFRFDPDISGLSASYCSYRLDPPVETQRLRTDPLASPLTPSSSSTARRPLTPGDVARVGTGVFGGSPFYFRPAAAAAPSPGGASSFQMPSSLAPRAALGAASALRSHMHTSVPISTLLLHLARRPERY